MSRWICSIALLAGLWFSPNAKAEAPGAWTVTLPLGLPLYLHGEPVWGTIHASTQTAGIIGSVIAHPKMNWAEDEEEFAKWAPLATGSSIAIGLSWFTSLVHAARLNELAREGEEISAAARQWDNALANRAFLEAQK